MLITAIAIQKPRLTVISEKQFEVVPDLFLHRLLPNLEAGFVAAEHVPIHQVRARAIEFLFAIVEKIIDARVLKESSNDGANMDVL